MRAKGSRRPPTRPFAICLSTAPTLGLGGEEGEHAARIVCRRSLRLITGSSGRRMATRRCAGAAHRFAAVDEHVLLVHVREVVSLLLQHKFGLFKLLLLQALQPLALSLELERAHALGLLLHSSLVLGRELARAVGLLLHSSLVLGRELARALRFLLRDLTRALRFLLREKLRLLMRDLRLLLSELRFGRRSSVAYNN